MTPAELLAYLVTATADGKSREEILEDIGKLARGESVDPKPMTATDWSIHHSQKLHEAYVAWIHGDDD